MIFFFKFEIILNINNEYNQIFIKRYCRSWQESQEVILFIYNMKFQIEIYLAIYDQRKKTHG